MQSWIHILAAALTLQVAWGAASKNQTEVDLILDASMARPGDTVTVGLRLKMAPGWHTYWLNPGDSGAPTKVTWDFPSHLAVGAPSWPVPEKLTIEGLTTYGYHGEAVILFPLSVSAQAPAGNTMIRAKLSWLECEKLCVQGRAEAQVAFAVGGERKPSPESGIIEKAREKLPMAGEALGLQTVWEGEAQGEERWMRIAGTNLIAAGSVDFFPYPAEAYEVSGDIERLTTTSGVTAFKKRLKRLGPDWPAGVNGLLVLGKAQPGYEVTLRPALPAPGSAASASTTSVAPAPTGPARMALMAWFAFLGGLVLNFMPCVLPVIALKIFAILGQDRESQGRNRLLGLVYALGVVFSFLLLAGLAIAAQKAGANAGWGMAFRNPVFRLLMTVLMTLVALNLFGVFEVTLSGRLAGSAGTLASRDGVLGAFLNGVLATVLATPCTAPFLSVALTFAFTQSPAVIILQFAAAGLGLAFPFVLFCWNSSWLRWLPRPGIWMEHFKVALGFPMLATAVWLFWSTAPRYGRSGALWLGLFLVVLAMSSWTWGLFVQRGSRGKGVAMAASLGLLLFGYFYLLENQLGWRHPQAASVISGSPSGGIAWERWSLEAVGRARAAGRPVFVDFTADTCLNCQINKKTSIEIDSTRRKLQAINAVTLLGDYTDEDPAIAAELKRYGRPGVPLVLVYPRNPLAPPIVLPEILTPGIVHDALARAGE